MIRIGITGMGAVSAAGIGVSALWQAARDGNSAVSALNIPRGEALRVRVAAALHDFDAAEHLTDQELKRTDRFSHFAHVAVNEALQQAGISADTLKGSRTSAIIGTGIGGMNTLDDSYHDFYQGKTRVHALSIPRIMPSSATSHVSITHQITGPSFCVTSACSSASQSIGIGAQLIRSGIVDRAIVGGSEACITPASMKAWEMMRVLSPDSSRPFSKDRNGMILGEGAGAFLLESEAAMAARGATPIAWLAGYGTSSDARDIIQPDVDGAAAAMQAALDDAGLSAGDIDYINAHGTGTVLNDINEAAAIRKIFGDLTDNIPVSSSKPVIGHTLGASGALELVITTMAMREGCIPPHINVTEPDPKCALNLPLNGAISRPIAAALSNSFAFGGINASLIVTAVR